MRSQNFHIYCRARPEVRARPAKPHCGLYHDLASCALHAVLRPYRVLSQYEVHFHSLADVYNVAVFFNNDVWNVFLMPSDRKKAKKKRH